MPWLLSSSAQTNTKGSSATQDTTDDVTSTTDRGARTTTRTIPTRTTTRAVAASTSRSGTNTVTVTEDAGGQVSFEVMIRGGLFNTNPTPVCGV